LEKTSSQINTTAASGAGDFPKKQLKLTANDSITSIVEQMAEHVPQEAASTLFIDPRLLTGAIDLESLEEDESKATAAVEEAYFDEVVSSAPMTSAPELQVDGLDFVRRFSRINVTTNQVLAQFGNHAVKDALITTVYSGNSRDPVSLWKYSCMNATFGCSYEHSFYAHLLEHEHHCKIISAEAFAELNEVKALEMGVERASTPNAGLLAISPKSMIGSRVRATRTAVIPALCLS
jgi:hypothetical protein